MACHDEKCFYMQYEQASTTDSMIRCPCIDTYTKITTSVHCSLTVFDCAILHAIRDVRVDASHALLEGTSLPLQLEHQLLPLEGWLSKYHQTERDNLGDSTP